MRQFLRGAALAGLLLGGSIGQVHADVVLSGSDSNAGTYSTSALSSLSTSSDTYSAAGLTGISLWGLLGGATGVTTSTPAGDNSKNAILRYYLVATGAGGATSVVSLGEIDPTFGGTAAVPAFLAYQASGGGLLSAPELVVPGAAGRDLTGVTSLALLAAPAIPSAGGGVSTSIALTGGVTKPGSYTASSLVSDFTPVTETVSGDTYTGVPLYTFINPADSDIASQIVVTQATDGYEVVFSLAELDPSLGGNPADLLPYADTGGNFPGDGLARTITPNDNAHGRWVSNLDAVEVLDVPEPASLMLLTASVALLMLVRNRRAPLHPQPR